MTLTKALFWIVFAKIGFNYLRALNCHYRHCDRCLYHVVAVIFNFEMRFFAVQQHQPALRAVQPKTIGIEIAVDVAGVFYDQFVMVFFEIRNYFYNAAFKFFANAMFDGVFYECLQHHGRNWLAECTFIDAVFDV